MGKSTTLYTLLSDLNSEKVNIVTVEDPVEYTLTGINQVNVNTKSGGNVCKWIKKYSSTRPRYRHDWRDS